MEDLQGNQGSSNAQLDGNAGHGVSAGQAGAAPLTGNASGQESESKTPGLGASPADPGATTPPWGNAPSAGGGQPQMPRGCTGSVVLALGAMAMLALLGALIAPRIL